MAVYPVHYTMPKGVYPEVAPTRNFNRRAAYRFLETARRGMAVAKRWLRLPWYL